MPRLFFKDEDLENAQHLREHLDQEELAVDRDSGQIRGVKLCSAESKNNREYTQQALKELAKLYERQPIRIDHDQKSYLTTVGMVRDARLDYADYVIRGTLSLNKGHPAYEQIMEDAEHRPNLLMLSHEVPARGYTATRKDGKLVVEHVHKVDCFAIVTNGGVNQSLFESEEDEMELKTVAELKEQYPALYEEVVKEAKAKAEDSDKLIDAIRQRDEALAKLQEAEEKLAEIEEAARLEERKASILAKAADMKVRCSEDLLEALLILEDEKVERVLASCPKLKEDGEEEKPQEKPKQRSGLGRKPKAYGSPSDLISKYAN